MPATHTTLTLEHSDGESVDLMSSATNGIQLVDEGYAPKIPRRVTAPVGGLGVYEAVEESITVNIYGDTAADCYSNLALLARLIDSAVDWRYAAESNAATPPARLELVIQPQGSTLAAPLRAVITDATEMPELAPTWNDLLGAYVIENVQITYTRRILVGTTETVTTTAAANGTIQTATFGSSYAIPSPLQWTMTPSQSGSTDSHNGFPPGFVCLASSSVGAGIRKVDGPTFWPGGSAWSQPTDSSNFPSTSSGSVARYTPTSTTPTITTSTTNLFTRGMAQQLVFLMKVRSSSATISWTIDLMGDVSLGSAPAVKLATTTVSGTTAAQAVSFGTVLVPSPIIDLYLQITPSATGASLDIESMVSVDMGEAANRVIGFSETGIDNDMWDHNPTITNGAWWRMPESTVWLNTPFDPSTTLNVLGRADTVMRGSGVQVLWYAVNGPSATNPTAWRPLYSPTTIINAAWTFTLAPAHLVPE